MVQRYPLLGLATVALVASSVLVFDAELGFAQDAAPDRLVYTDGGERKELADGQIQSIDAEKVTYDGRRDAEVPAGDVVSITWGDAPSEYAQGWAAVNAGNGERAVSLFETCLQAHVALELRDWVVEYSNVGLGEGYRLMGSIDAANFGKAVAAYDKARKKNDKSYYLDVILAGIADASIAMDKPQDALKAASDLERAAKSAKRPVWELQALSLQGRAQRAAKSYDNAARAYKELASAAERLLDSVDGSRAERVRGFLHEGLAEQGWVLVQKALASKSVADFTTAKGYFEGLSPRYDSVRPLMAARSNALGVVQLENGGDVWQALEHFKRAQVLHFGSQAEEARSLYHQAQCYEKIGDDEQRQARVDELKRYFPESEWARRL